MDPMGGPFTRERRGSGPEKQQPKHNPCRPVGRNWKEPILLHNDHVTLWWEITGTWTPECLARANLIGRDPKGIPRRSIKSVKWYSSSQVWPQNMWLTHSWPQHYCRIFSLLDEESNHAETGMCEYGSTQMKRRLGYVRMIWEKLINLIK